MGGRQCPEQKNWAQEKQQFAEGDNELSGRCELDKAGAHPASRKLEMRLCSPGEKASGPEKVTKRDS